MKKGIDYVKTDVGDKYVSESMRANGHRLGGEQSGHIIFGKYATTGDGVLTAIKLMQVMIEKKASLRELCAPMKVYPQLLQSICVTDRNAVMHDPEFAAGIARAEQALGGNGRILVRQERDGACDPDPCGGRHRRGLRGSIWNGWWSSKTGVY